MQKKESSSVGRKQSTGTSKVKKGRYTIYLTDEERAKLEMIANRRSTSYTQVIRDLIREYEIHGG